MDITIRGATPHESNRALGVVIWFATAHGDRESGIQNCVIYEYVGDDWVVYWTAARNIVVRRATKEPLTKEPTP